MTSETFSLLLGAWGAVTGTLALVIQFLGHRSDQSRLHVAASMVYGNIVPGVLKYGYFISVQLTNSGRRVVRIKSISLRLRNPLLVKFNKILFRNNLVRQQELPSDIEIYSGAVDPIHDFIKNPKTTTYPPSSVTLEENQTISLRLPVLDSFVAGLPKPKAWLIVTDHVGRTYKAQYFSSDLIKEPDTKSQPQPPQPKPDGSAQT